MISVLKWLAILGFSGLLAWTGMGMNRLISASQNAVFSYHARRMSDKPTLMLWVNGSCPLSRQYAPAMSQFIRKAKSLNWNTVMVSVNDTVCDPLFQALEAGFYVQDPKGTFAQWFNVSVIPVAMLFKSKPNPADPSGSLVYRGAIDNWAWETGKHRQSTDEHYLKDAMDALASGKPIQKKSTKANGCFIEISQ